MDEQKDQENPDTERSTVTLPGIVEKIMLPVDPQDPKKAQILMENADPLYQEIRIDNVLHDAAGNLVELKKGAEVQVTIVAAVEQTTPKK
jgi:hypothetical protein